MERNEMRLCGGSFFMLLLQARGQRRNSRMGEGRASDGKSDTEVLKRLIRIVNSKFEVPVGRSFNTFTSNYKMCRVSDTPAVALTDDLIVQRFNQSVQDEYYHRLLGFYNLFEGVIDWEVKGAWLVAALLDLIEADSTISEETRFYVRPFGHAVVKSELRNIECICCPAFVFGMWHYVVTNIHNNSIGAKTIELFLEKGTESRAERKFISDIGMETVKQLNTSIDTPECELGYAPKPALDDSVLKMPFVQVLPGVAVGYNGNNTIEEIEPGHIRISSGPKKSLKEYLGATVNKFDTYLTKSIDFYSTVKTLLYAETPCNFDKIYVPNDIGVRVIGTGKTKPLEVPIVDAIAKPFDHIILAGTGGIGKSMMMQHLYLHFSKNYEKYRRLPVLVHLKNFSGNGQDLDSFIFRSLQEFDLDLAFEDFRFELACGNCLLLLDGMDEIPTAVRGTFEKQLTTFTKMYRSPVVISSRPNSSFVNFVRFHVFEIEPFTKSKAIELIDKLDYHDLEAKKKFREDLEDKLFRSHKQFASNPLLLTIMLMTYTSYGDVPAKRHVFYAKAYETMARLHDATKGAYVRPMHTELTPEEFSVYFAEFCARTYREEVLEFTEKSFTDYMSKVLQHQRSKIKATAKEFLLDLTNNLCIMYKEGEKYYFIHRSFQEYFSAVFFANQMDDQLERIGFFFENQIHRQLGDRTFDMLYDMIPERIDRYVFLPYLEELLEECDEEDGYWTFLEKLYPVIYAYEGQPGDYRENDPESFLYNFIINEFGRRHNGELDRLEWPNIIDMCDRKEWASIRVGNYCGTSGINYRTEILDISTIDSSYFERFGEPDIEGVSWELDPHRIYTMSDVYWELFEFLEDDNFPLKKEYNAIIKLTKIIGASFEKKKSADDWFDAF